MPSLSGLTGQAPTQPAAASGMPPPAAAASFSFAALPDTSAATQQQQQQPTPAAVPSATAAASNGPAPSESTPSGATPVVGGAKLQMSAPSTTAGSSLFPR